jgi:hypothetical protein
LNLAPIILFVYNRPEHTLQTLDALSNNELSQDSHLFIYCDGAKQDSNQKNLNAIAEVRQVILEKQWCGKVTVKESQTNLGLAKSIVSGVTELLEKFGKIIVLEDDIVTSRGFLKYMNEALNLYENQEKVMHLGSYIPKTTGYKDLPETFFSRFMSCWGWATWKRSWQKANWDTDYLYQQISDPKIRYEFNLEGALDFHRHLEMNISGEINTWAIKWFATIFINNGLCLYPGKSLSTNIGFDGSGENCDDQQLESAFDYDQIVAVAHIPIKESRIGKNYLKRFYLYGSDSSLSKILKHKYIHHRYQIIKKIKGL